MTQKHIIFRGVVHHIRHVAPAFPLLAIDDITCGIGIQHQNPIGCKVSGHIGRSVSAFAVTVESIENI